MWLIFSNRAMQIVEYNVNAAQNGTKELWVKRSDGKTIMILRGSSIEVDMYYGMFNKAIQGGHKFVEVAELM